MVVRNRGVAFGLFPGDFWIFPSLLLVIIIFYYASATRRDGIISFPISMIAAGGISNLIDRMTKGAIIDFIKIPVWPTAFNTADLVITFGVILFLWSLKLFTKTNK